MKMNMLLVVGNETTRLMLKKALTEHSPTMLGVFTSQMSGLGTVVQFYYSCQVYEDLSG